MAFGEIFLRDTAGSPERAHIAILAARVVNRSQRRIWFILRLPIHSAIIN